MLACHKLGKGSPDSLAANRLTQVNAESSTSMRAKNPTDINIIFFQTSQRIRILFDKHSIQADCKSSV